MDQINEEDIRDLAGRIAIATAFIVMGLAVVVAVVLEQAWPAWVGVPVGAFIGSALYRLLKRWLSKRWDVPRDGPSGSR
jgi:hypothetical protein